VRLARVFDHNQAVAPGQLQDRVHVRGLAVKVNGDNGPHRYPQLAVHHVAAAIHVAPALQVLGQLARVHVVRALVDIDENRPRAGLGDGLRRGDERIRDRDDDGPLLEARRHESESHRVGAAGHAHTVPSTAELGEIALESFDHGAAYKRPGPQGCGENLAEFFF